MPARQGGGLPAPGAEGCLDDFYSFNRIHSLDGLVGWAGARGGVCCVILAGYLVGLVDGLFVLLGGWDCELWRLEAVILVLYDRDVAMDSVDNNKLADCRNTYGDGWRGRVLDTAHWIVLVLSVLLIVFISYDTFKDIPFLESRSYMLFQLAVCIVFMADFFLELALAKEGDRRDYVKGRWIYLLLSVPYLNIIDGFDLSLSEEALYFVRFVPLARGGLALVIVLNYISANKMTGIFVSYLSILLLCTYFAALIFYEREMPVNPRVPDYWSAFLWCCLQTTTLGSAVAPVTVAGKVISVVLSFMGIMMYPLFTVYLSTLLLKSRAVLNIINFRGNNVKNGANRIVNGDVEGQTVAHSDKND